MKNNIDNEKNRKVFLKKFSGQMELVGKEGLLGIMNNLHTNIIGFKPKKIRKPKIKIKIKPYEYVSSIVAEDFNKNQNFVSQLHKLSIFLKMPKNNRNILSSLKDSEIEKIKSSETLKTKIDKSLSLPVLNYKLNFGVLNDKKKTINPGKKNDEINYMNNNISKIEGKNNLEKNNSLSFICHTKNNDKSNQNLFNRNLLIENKYSRNYRKGYKKLKEKQNNINVINTKRFNLTKSNLLKDFEKYNNSNKSKEFNYGNYYNYLSKDNFKNKLFNSENRSYAYRDKNKLSNEIFISQNNLLNNSKNYTSFNQKNKLYSENQNLNFDEEISSNHSIENINEHTENYNFLEKLMQQRINYLNNMKIYSKFKIQ